VFVNQKVETGIFGSTSAVFRVLSRGSSQAE
jgi:hypothetical protein